jgi:bifunctional DNA-binding transcriptional regulator/antitoxin component of YhaV-PrlF toxin-antitoxin module
MLPSTTVSTQKKNGNEYFYTYMPQEIATRLGIKTGSRIMWNVCGSIATIIPYPDSDVNTQVELKLRKLLKDKKEPNLFSL